MQLGEMQLGRVGAFSIHAAVLPWAVCKPAVQEIERLGYATLWVPEGGFLKEAFANMALLLSATERMVLATAVANVWARSPSAMEHGSRTLAEAHPDRFLLGLGIAHREEVDASRGLHFEKPVEMMRDYLDRMEQAPYLGPLPGRPAPRVIAAMAPRMLALAAERTAGTQPYFVPVEHTAWVRDRVGPDKIVAPGLPVALRADRDEARRLAREHCSRYLKWENYRANLRRMGFHEDELHGCGSDRLVDAIVAQGDEEAIRKRVEAHLAAGASHVAVQPLPMLGPSFPLEDFRRLAEALHDLG